MKIEYINGEMLAKMFKQGSFKLSANREIVDSLNVFPVPDGDTGTNMSLTLESSIDEIDKLKELTAKNVGKAVSTGSLMGARGNSGVILSQILRGFEKGCRDKEVLDIEDFAIALKEASATAYKAVMKPIEGTILTIIRETGSIAIELSNRNIGYEEFFKLIIKHAEETLEKTPDQLDVLKQAGVVDAGGKGLVFILKGFYEALTGKEDSFNRRTSIESPKPTEVTHQQGNIEFGYCTEFIVKGNNLSSDALKDKIEGLGDSMLVVGDDGIIKVHIHTNNPGKALEHGLGMGELINIKIDNMREQHRNRIFDEKEHNNITPEELKEYGFIAVAMGEGLHSIFKDLNIDKVITGGQTMNPSTEDLVRAIEDINAKNIFILPNNSNIILAANQAKELSEKNVIVLPTKTIPQGITSIIEFNPSLNIEDNIDNMMDAIKEVKTVQVTYAVRDSKFNELTIKENDILGLFDGKIVTVGDSINPVALEVLDNTIDKDCEIITIYYGEEIDDSDANTLASEIERKYPDMDVEVYYGGQPLYYYIFSIE